MTPGIRRLLSACSLAILASLPLAVLSASAQAPAWPERVDRRGQEGDVVTIAFQALAPEGQTLSYSASGLPRGLSINAATGLVSGTLAVSDAGTVNTNGSAGTHTVTLTALSSSGQSSPYTFEWTVSRFRRGDVFAGIGDGKYRVYSEEGVFKYELTTDRAEDFVDHTGYNYGWYRGTTTGCGYNWVSRRMYFTSFDDDYDPSLSEIDPVPATSVPATAFPYNRLSTFRDSGLEKGDAASGRPIDGAPESVVFATDLGPDRILGTSDDIPGVMYVSHAGGYYNADEMPADIEERPLFKTDDWITLSHVDINNEYVLDTNGQRVPWKQGVSADGFLEVWPGRTWMGPGGPIAALIQWGRDIQKFVPSGGSYARVAPGENPLVEGFDTYASWQGTDWMDISSDQRTIFYTSEGGTIHRYDVAQGIPDADRQLDPYATLMPFNMDNPVPVVLYALRLLPPGDGTGGLLVAEPTAIRRLSENGTILNSYDAADGDGWFALNISPDGRYVWSASTRNGRIYRWNIASGELYSFPNGIGTNGIVSGAALDAFGNYTLDGLCVMGEYTAAQEVCGDGIDNDEDGMIDEVCQPIEACSNLSPGDDDGDGLVDTNDPDCPNTVNVCAATGYTDPKIAGYCARFNREGDTVSLSPAPGPPFQSGHIETYVVSGLPPGITAASNGVLSGVPQYTIRRNDDVPDTVDYRVRYEVTRRQRTNPSVIVAEFEQEFTWTIQNVNRPPVATPFNATVRPNIAVPFTFPTQTGGGTAPCAVDPDCEDTVTVTSTTTPTPGTLTNVGATYTWTPPTNFAGVVSYNYTISDGRGGTDTDTATITVVNRPPVAAVDRATIRPGQSIPGAIYSVPINLTANDSDPDGDALTVISVGAAQGTVTRSGNLLSYQAPPAPFTGVDSFTYTISDPYGLTTTSQVIITIVNTRPVANNDSGAGRPGLPVAVNVLTNDTDPDTTPTPMTPDTLTVVSNTAPSNGSVTRSGGTFTYTSNSGYVGTDSFTYTINDGYGLTSTATVTITLTNTAPVANPDSGVTRPARPVTVNVLANDTDANSDTLSVTATSDPANGSVVINPDRTVTYTSDPGFTGVDTFTYTASDGFGGTDTETVTITVINTAPVANPDSATTRPGIAVPVEVLGNDTDADVQPTPDAPDTISVVSNTAPSNGSVTRSGGTFTYTSNTGFVGTDTFTYTITDDYGARATTTVTITVINTAPIANPDSGSTRPGVPVSVSVLGNDTDPDAAPTPLVPDTISVTSHTAPSNGSVTRSGGTFIYTSVSGFVGTDTFTYTISDNYGATATTTVTITVGNRAPIAIDDAVSTIAGYRSPSFNILTMGTPDSDPDGDSFSLTSFTTPSNGTLTQSGTSPTFDYMPNFGFSGIDTFTYVITDVYGLSDTATVTITVVNQPPVAVNDSGTTEGTRPVTVGVLLNDSDPDNHVISVTGATTPSNGTAVVNANGTITYTANPGFQGTDTFFYTITDGYGGQSTATVTITVGPPNRFDPCLCSTAKASPGEIWPPNHKRTEVVTITDLEDPDGGPLTIRILGIYQDEPTDYLGDGDTEIDAGGVGTSTAWVRAERTGNPNIPGNGRVYEIVFEATAADGSTCQGSVFTGVPHDQGQGNVIIDDGIRYDSTVAGGPIVRTALQVEGGLTDADVTARGFELKYVAEARIGGTGASGAANRELIIGPSVGATADTADFTWTSGEQVTFIFTKEDDDVTLKLVTANQDREVTYDAECANGECDDIFIRAQSGGTGRLVLSGLSLNGLGIAETLTIPVGGPARSIHLAGLSLGDGMRLTGLARMEWTSDRPEGADVNFRIQVGTACPVEGGSGGGGGSTPPLARSDAYSTDEDTPLVVDAATGILPNDLTFAGPLTAELIATTANGTLSLSGNGSFTYTPNPNFNGQDTFRYRVSDGSLWSEPALVTITVNPSVDPPTAVDDSATTNENTPVSIAVLGNDSDPFDGPLAITALTQPSNGSAVVSGTAIVYTPAPGFIGVDTFTYTITGTEGTDTATVTVTVRNINEPPVAVNNSYTTAEDTPLTVSAPGILANDTDPDAGDTLASILVTGPSNGTLTLAADGSFVYTPAANFTGADSYTYRARDAGGLDSNVATVSITITPVNDPPVAVDDAHVVSEDSALQINSPGVKSNDSDPDTELEDLTVSLVTGAQRGSLTLNPDGSFLYTPFPDVTGSDTFTYRLSDGTGSDTAVVTIAITDSPDPPVAVDDAATTQENTPVTIAVLGNDSDPDTETLTIQGVTQGSNGTAAIAGSQVTYTPNAGFSGQDVFTYTITDGQATATATVTVTIAAVNDPPVASPDAYTTPRNTALTVPAAGVLVNDTDPDTEALTAIKVSDPSNGTVVLNANGSFTYTPATGFVGTDTFTYRANDGEADSNTTTVTITITAVNAPPVAVDDSATTNAGQAVTIAVIGNDSDPDGDTFSVTANTGASNGTVTRSGNTFVYTPNTGFTGTDSFEYTITDSEGATDTAVVTITVSQVCSTSGQPGGLVRKWTMFDAGGRVDGNVQMMGAYNATFNSNTVLAGDLFMIGTPQLTVNGTPTYTLVNGTGSATPTSHQVMINAGATLGRLVQRTNAISVPTVSNPPTNYGSRSVVMNGPTDNPGDFATIRHLTLNSNVGAVTVPPGTYGDFIANAGSSFVIGVPGATTPSVYNFQRLTLNAGSTRLTVVGPVTVTVRYGATFHGSMGAQASPDWLTLRVAGQTVQLDSQMQFYGHLVAPNSQLIVNAGTLLHGSFVSDTFTVNSSGRVVLTGQGCQQAEPPTAQNDAYTTTEDTPLTVVVPGVLANDTDPNGGALTASLVNGPSNGTVSLNGTGSFTYTPNTNYTGADTYTYRVSNGAAFSSPATVTITITGTPDPPVAVDDSATTTEETAVTINVLGNDTDPDTTTLTLESVTQPANGTVAIVSGQARYTPNPDFSGTDLFTYVVSDGTSTDTANVTVTVTAVNDPPVAANDSYTMVQNTTLNASESVLVNDSDPEGQTLTAQLVTQPSTGSVVFQPSGGFSYTPPTGFTGTVTFTYRVSDGTSSSNIATVTIVVTAANRPPVAVNDAYSTDKNVPLTVAVPGILSNDSDPDAGNTITASLVSGTAANTGTVTLNANGSFTFTPANNYHGTTTFRYRAVDNQNAQSNEAIVTIVVNNVTNSGRVCYDGGSSMTAYRAQIDWIRLSNGDITARASVSRNYADNTYGVNKIGWGNKKRDFKAVYNSDFGQLAFYDASGSKKIDFKIDLLSAMSGTPSGYGTLGVNGGDGAMVTGSASNIVSLDTSMNQNMNAFGYVTTASNHPLKSYSPATNANYTPNSTYPLWIWDMWYEATIKASTFGSAGFGSVSLRALHASPPKATVNTWRLISCQ